MRYGETNCRIEGCGKPRWSGTKLVMCEEHAHAYFAEKNQARRDQRNKNKSKLPAVKRGRPSNKQQPVTKTFKFLLVDHVTGDVLRVSGVVEQRVPMADLRSGALHEETEQLFMRKGYAVGERNRAS